MTGADGAIKKEGEEEGDKDEDEECKRNVDDNFSSPLSHVLPLDLVPLPPFPFLPSPPFFRQGGAAQTSAGVNSRTESFATGNNLSGDVFNAKTIKSYKNHIDRHSVA